MIAAMQLDTGRAPKAASEPSVHSRIGDDMSCTAATGTRNDPGRRGRAGDAPGSTVVHEWRRRLASSPIEAVNRLWPPTV